MAKIRRAGFGTVFNIENEKVGIGTTGKFFTEVRVLKNLELSDANVVTQAQLENYQGFLSNEARLSGNDVDLNKLVGYVRGEAYYGESHAHTQDDGSVVNMVGSAHTSFSHNVIDDSSNIQYGAMGDIIIDGEFTVSSGTTYCSSVDQLTSVANFTVPTGDTDDRIHCHTAGSMRFNENLGTLEFYTGEEWRTVNSFKDTGNRGRGVIMGGNDGSSNLNDISYINISSLGDALDFGNLTEGVGYINGNNVSSSTRGLRQGGYTPSRVNTVDYITMASTGDATNFGDLTTTSEGGSGCSSSTRAIRAGGSTGSHVNVIDYAEIATVGNYLDFGDLPTDIYNGPDGVSNGTRGIFAGGSRGGNSGVSRIDVISIASKGNSTKFGDLIRERRNVIPCANNTRGIFMGGRFAELAGEGSFVEYITMASDGNSVYFGDLNTDRFRGAGTNNHIRGVAVGGDTNQPNGSNINVIEFINIASTGNAEDFGDAVHKYEAAVGCSDSHGGLGGF